MVLVNKDKNQTYMDCIASCMSCIHVLRSSLELARTSIISGFSIPAVMRKRPRSSLATSLTISFWREMTVERWSCSAEEKGRGREMIEGGAEVERDEARRKTGGWKTERGRQAGRKQQREVIYRD